MTTIDHLIMGRGGKRALLLALVTLSRETKVSWIMTVTVTKNGRKRNRERLSRTARKKWNLEGKKKKMKMDSLCLTVTSLMEKVT
jgi:hypothetical protein